MAETQNPASRIQVAPELALRAWPGGTRQEKFLIYAH
jgi:hypothetical protein